MIEECFFTCQKEVTSRILEDLVLGFLLGISE